MIKALIVDDEPPARREMRRMLAEFEDVKVAGEAADLAVARGMLLRVRPDVVFLDIHLGRESGFDLLSDVDAECAVIFVTAHDDYAVQAFDASALDYLLKPVDAKRLRASLDRLRARADAPTPATPVTYAAKRWIFLDSGGRQEFIEIARITHIEAEDGGTRVFTVDGIMRSAPQTLVEWENRVSAADFVRVHRSAIVNLRHVELVEPWSHYSYRIKVRGSAAPIPMSRRYAARLRDALG